MTHQRLSIEIMDTIPEVMKVIRAEMRRMASRDLSVAHFRTLAKISKAPQTNKELADWIGIGAPSMCRAVDILVKKGLARRLEAKDDRREIRIVATAKGIAKVEKVRDATRHKLLTLLKGIDAETQQELEAGLLALKKVFHP